MSHFCSGYGFKNFGLPGLVSCAALWSWNLLNFPTPQPSHGFLSTHAETEKYKIACPLTDTIVPNPLPKTAIENEPAEIFITIEEKAEFEGGENALLKYIAENIKCAWVYKDPASAAPGKVVVQFAVELNGKVSEVKIIWGNGGAYDEEIIHVLKSTSGKWKPGKLSGIPMKTWFTLPLRACSGFHD